jgi:hypothetical protein
MLKISCLSCNSIITIPEFIDTEKYEGQLACKKRNSLLYVKIIAGKIQKYKIVEDKMKPDIKLVFTPVVSKKENKKESK